ncbi:MAG: phosphoribosylamine--glycine ligase [Candidatus Omnitrophota bacterium]
MRILVLGSGGREHALAWKIAQSRLADKVFCAPGNGGICDSAECLDIKADDIASLLDFSRREKIDLTVVGPEAPLVSGIADEFAHYGLNVFAPSRAAAGLEASKVFAKELMAKYNVATADFRVFDDAVDAKRYVQKKGAPCVVKAEGLAQGKGVVVSETTEEAVDAISAMMEKKVFGDAGRRVVIEDCLMGEEASILVLTDSKTVVPLASSQDHKRVFDGDRGPNTGGMGAYSPAPVVSRSLWGDILNNIIYRTVDGLAREGIEYRGVLYAGIMITREGPKVLEFNVRFGDPETQAVLPRLESDLVEIMMACAKGGLLRFKNLKWNSRACVSVVMSSAGYPGSYEKGKEILGLDEAVKTGEVVVFHAGTKKLPAGNGQEPARYVTNGGRVLDVTGLDTTIKGAIKMTYQAVEKIKFEGAHYRSDIGQKALAAVSS